MMFDGVCFCTPLNLYLFPTFALCFFQVLAVHSEAEREKIEAKRKIAKLEDALRYSKREMLFIACIKKRRFRSSTVVKLNLSKIQVQLNK